MKRQLLFGAAVTLILLCFTHCEKETLVYNYDEVSQYELNRTVSQINTTNVATGLESIFNTMVSDSTNRAHLCQTFVDAARFNSDNSGYFFIETLKDAWVVAHINHDLIGTCRIDIKDIYGKYFIQELVNTARYIGYGFVEYYRSNPATNEIERKLSFVTNMPTVEWFIGTGFYGDPPEKYYTEQEAGEWVLMGINQTLARGFGGIFESVYTTEADQIAFSRNFVDHIRFFDDQSGYFFMLDADCMTIAHGADQSLEGESMYDYQDPNGRYIMREMVAIAQSEGEGYLSYSWDNPISGMVEGKTSFVIAIPGTNYLIGSGFYNK